MTRNMRPQISISVLFWLTICVACFIGGWLLQPPSFEEKVTEPFVLNAAVLRTQNNIAVISVGTADGVKIGERFHVSRAGNFVASGTVSREDSNLSAVVLDKANVVKEGDEVTFAIQPNTYRSTRK